MLETSDKTEPVYPAATVVLVRDSDEGPQALLVQRNNQVRHMGGMWVFPGGRVDAADTVSEGDEYAAAVNAAIRETSEEVGLVIDAEQLVYMSHWTTPEGAKRRFATWFFLVFLEDDQEVEVDGGEIVNHRWVRPEQAWVESNDTEHELRLMPPTYVSLSTISNYADCAELRCAVESAPVDIFAPRLVTQETALCFLYEGDAGYASIDVGAPGPRHRSYMRDGHLEYVREP